MQRRISRDNEAVSPVIAVILMVAITVVLAAVLYVWAASFLDQGESSPIAAFGVKKSSDGTYGVVVISISQKVDLKNFDYFLKDTSQNTRSNGEIAIQNISGTVVGIEVAEWYDAKDPTDTDETDDLDKRADAVTNETGDCAGGKCPVTFYDNDYDDKLSVGDQFIIRGVDYGTDYDADSDWWFEIQYLTGDIIGSKKLP